METDELEEVVGGCKKEHNCLGVALFVEIGFLGESHN